MNKGLLVLVMVVLCRLAWGQDVVLETEPSSIRWSQIKTPSFQVIFPEGFDSQALRVANTLEALKDAETKTLSPSLPSRIPIVLHMYQSVSNGLVGMGPWRSELNMIPSPRADLQGLNSWQDLVTSHEFRHVVQFHHSRQGFNRLVYYLFGQQSQAGMAFAAVPRWFWEGDATLIETLHTPGGRGRIPAFGRVYRTNFLEGKRYDYNKQHLGSYKDFIPDHYQLGYYFVTHIRRRTRNPKIWEDVTADAFRKSIIPFTFSNALKKHTGIHLVQNYELMMDELDEVYREQLVSSTYADPEEILTRKETTYTDYLYPQPQENGRVIALKTGIGHFSQFVSISPDGQQSVVHIPGVFNDVGMLSVRNNKVVYTEFQFDPRWRERTYSVLKIHDITTGKTRQLSHKTRFQGGDLSPDGTKIVTSESTSGQEHHLIVLDAGNGIRLNTLQNTGNGYYTAARWSDDGRFIVAVKQHDSDKDIILYDYLNNQEKVVYRGSGENISHAVMYDSLIFYNSPYNGIDNIYVYNLVNNERYRVTKSKYGAYNPAVSSDGQWLYYNEHRLNGMDVVKVPLQYNWEYIEEVPDQAVNYFEPLLQEESGGLPDTLQMNDYPVQRYSRAGHMFNIHSWGLLATTDQNSLDVGLSSRDVISTTQLSAGYRYDLTENTGVVYGQVSYQGLYPIIDVGVEYGRRNSNRGFIDSLREVEFDWKELTLYGGVRLPLLLTNSKMLSEFVLSNRVGVTRVTDFTNSQEFPQFIPPEYAERSVPWMRTRRDSLAFFYNDEISNGILLSNNLSLTYYRLLKRSPRDINSRYGFIVNGRWLSTPFGGDFSAHTLAARLIVYLPSPFQLTKLPAFRHHSFFVTGAWQSSETAFTPDLYNFRNQIPRPRGFAYPLTPEFYYVGANYTLPLWYPDIALGPVAYFKRLRANVFYDYGEGSQDVYLYDYKNDEEITIAYVTDEYRSAGIELSVDMHVMRYPQEFGIGLRYSRLLTTNQNSFDLLLSIAF